jgi:hypothetical protein
MYLWEGRQYNLYHAAGTESVETIDLLLEYGATDISKGCLLHAAVQSRSIMMIQHILTLGVDANEPDNAHQTGLMYGTPLHRVVANAEAQTVASTKSQTVASTHDLNAVKILLAHGASINQPGKVKCRGKTVVDMIMKDEVGERIPDNIRDLIKEVAQGEGMTSHVSLS